MKGLGAFLLACFDDDVENPQTENLLFILVLFPASLILAELIELLQGVFDEVVEGYHLQEGVGSLHVDDEFVLFFILFQLRVKDFFIRGGKVLFFFVVEPPEEVDVVDEFVLGVADGHQITSFIPLDERQEIVK